MKIETKVSAEVILVLLDAKDAAAVLVENVFGDQLVNLLARRE